MIEERDWPTINSLGELLNEVSYSWEYPRHTIIKYDGGYELNKLYIEPGRMAYKTHHWVLAPGVYESFETYYNFLQMLEVV